LVTSASVAKIDTGLKSANTRVVSWPSHAAFDWSKLTWVLLDAGIVLVNGLFVLLLFGTRINTGIWDPSAKVALPDNNLRFYFGSLFLYVSLIILACASAELYSPIKALERSRLRVIAKPFALATGLFSVFLWCMNVGALQWTMIVLLTAFELAAIVGWRKLQCRLVLSRAATGYGFRRALIVGAGATGRELAQYLTANALLGYSVVGFLDDESSDDSEILGRISQFSQVVHAQFIDDVLVAGAPHPGIIDFLSSEATKCRVNMELVPGVSEFSGHWQYIGDLPVKVVRCEPIPNVGPFFKRVLDIIGAFLGLIALLPFLIMIAILVYVDSPGPALYSSWRVGKKGVRFKCVKFRTMVPNADENKDRLRAINERSGPTFKVHDDPRITRLGKYLRKYSLDEVPQLWNVLWGDMSLVGPRPHPLDDYRRYELEHRVRLTVTPGLTGLWQITARTDSSFEKNMALDLEYIRNWSFRRDIKILLATIPAVFRGEGT
jgi:exopolysaccharide biosynthesis polyprenyl glycosylphosphotransferase